MKQLIINIIMTLSLLVVPAMGISAPAYAAARRPGCGTPSASKTQVLKGIGQASTGCDSSGVTKAVAAAVNILSYIVGIAAIVAIISSGFKYITSGGDSGRVANAKNTLVYALVGIAIAGLAQFLVHFVLNLTTKT